MAKRRFPLWAIAIVAVPGAIALFVAGLFTYVSVTATPLHPNPQEVPSVTQTPPSPAWTASVSDARQIARTTIAGQNWPGLSIAVGVNGEIVWAEGFGFADIDDRTPVAPNMRFRMGTASMALTSAGVGVLLDQNRIALDREIQTYVPEYPKKLWPVTLRELMAHTGGVGTDDGDEGPFGEHCDKPAEGVKLFKNKDLLFEPGTRYRFSTFGWILVSAAVEAAAKEAFYTFMRAEVFGPLGLEDTTPESRTEPVPGRVSFYFPRFAADNKYGPEAAQDPDYSCYAGAYAFLSTPSDLVRFGMAMNSGKLVKPATVQLLQTSERLRSGEETGYGLGWDLKTIDVGGKPTRTVGHNGSTIGGMTMSLVTLPDRKLTIAVMTNTSWAETNALAAKIASAFAR